MCSVQYVHRNRHVNLSSYSTELKWRKKKRTRNLDDWTKRRRTHSREWNERNIMTVKHAAFLGVVISAVCMWRTWTTFICRYDGVLFAFSTQKKKHNSDTIRQTRKRIEINMNKEHDGMGSLIKQTISSIYWNAFFCFDLLSFNVIAIPIEMFTESISRIFSGSTLNMAQTININKYFYGKDGVGVVGWPGQFVRCGRIEAHKLADWLQFIVRWIIYVLWPAL